MYLSHLIHTVILNLRDIPTKTRHKTLSLCKYIIYCPFQCCQGHVLVYDTITKCTRYSDHNTTQDIIIMYIYYQCCQGHVPVYDEITKCTRYSDHNTTLYIIYIVHVSLVMPVELYFFCMMQYIYIFKCQTHVLLENEMMVF